MNLGTGVSKPSQMVPCEKECDVMDEEPSSATEQVSLCATCAKHPEVRALVTSDLTTGICGACGRTDVNVFNPERFKPLRNLIRALIRLHFSEDDYNSHWGGTSISEVLLGQENPILEVATCDDYQDDLIDRLTWEGEIYPDSDEGICLFAGDDGTGRGIQFSIPETLNSELQDIELRLERENFHAVEAAMEEMIDRIKDDIEATVQAGSLWYRCRIGVEEHSTHFDWRKVTHVATPYKGSAISSLPPLQASAGRTNRQGVSVLYVASKIETALAEIRPHPSHFVSVGGFRSRRELRVARFDLPIGQFSSSDVRLDLYALIYHIDTLLSAPVIPEERHRYSATQLLSDVLIRKGFDGVIYRSSVGNGINLCVFDPATFDFDEGESAVMKIENVHYRFSNVETSLPS